MKKKTEYFFLFGIIMLLIFLGIFLFLKSQQPFQEHFSQTREIEVPAILEEKGIISKMSLTLKKGSGRIFFDTTEVLVSEDTEQSAKEALDFAFKFLGVNRSDFDAIIRFKADAQVVEGSSAEVSIAIAAISILENKTLKRNVMITGTLNPDGTIAPVQKTREKFKAAERAGKKLFLVPYGSSQEINTSESTTEVKEVADIREALNYFYDSL
jgi:uncharacterized protein